jgi:hypothetical protein
VTFGLSQNIQNLTYHHMPTSKINFIFILKVKRYILTRKHTIVTKSKKHFLLPVLSRLGSFGGNTAQREWQDIQKFK